MTWLRTKDDFTSVHGPGLIYGPPHSFARVFQHGITPGMVNEHDLVVRFPPIHFAVRGTGQSQIHTVHTLPIGEGSGILYRASARTKLGLAENESVTVRWNSMS